ncbi:zinc finger BED domain-containing protein RICESLEEPER 2-like protein [Tanacetum coccineum]|uniref:Zinc finger BED domain-containing protein RICESLEEPER 2-like protein n=1 Tax=Tanacetum coccineum TaxID=301880 RepID=A0ABQ5HWM9_9ASTR
MASGTNNNPPELGVNSSNSNNQSQTTDLGDEHEFKKRKRACKSKDTSSLFPILATSKYDPTTTRELISHWVLMHEHPFSIIEEHGLNLVFKSMQHGAEYITRNTVKNDCMSVYEIEKKKLKNLLAGVKRISITTDLWKSKNQNIEYMVITGHFVDANWKLQKRVLSFVDIPPPRRGIEIADSILKCLREWEIEEKIMTIFVDNASANDAAMKILVAHYKRLENLFCVGKFSDGKFFHVRCCAHILNLMVQDGLSVIKDIVSKVHASVSYINASDARLKVFSQVVQQLHLPDRKLILDCKTRWNSTYKMLSAAISFKEAFSMYEVRDPLYKHCPSDDDWEKLESICKTLEAFDACTNIISGSDYPTSNLYFGEVQYIKQVLDRQFNDEREWLRKMVTKMKEKFDKYWNESNMLMCIGSILDPRCPSRGFSYYYSRLKQKDVLDLKSLDLDVYLEEGIYLCKDNSAISFNILDWWKSDEAKFPVLSKMASHFLAIPITTVASEATFSAGGHVIDTYRASLDPEIVQALICGGDWIHKLHGVKKKNKKEKKPQEIVLVDVSDI